MVKECYHHVVAHQTVRVESGICVFAVPKLTQFNYEQTCSEDMKMFMVEVWQHTPYTRD